MSDFGDFMGKADQRILAAFDRDLQEFRLSYQQRMSSEDRCQVTDWLRQLVKLEEQCLAWPGLNLKIHVSHDLYDQNGECLYSGGASMNPRVLLGAVEAWEHGEEFAPRSGLSTL